LDRREVSLQSPGLSRGWHDAERNWRWTDGDAMLTVRGARELAFEVARTGTYWLGRQWLSRMQRTEAADRQVIRA
jgi:hypothetical protein